MHGWACSKSSGLAATAAPKYCGFESRAGQVVSNTLCSLIIYLKSFSLHVGEIAYVGRYHIK